MRKPRDIDAELKALADKQRSLKTRKVQQLGELVVATGADRLDIETLAGVLLDALARTNDKADKETLRARGEDFFRREHRSHANGAARAASATPGDGSAPAASSSREGAA